MGDGGKGTDKSRGNGTGTVDDVQVGGSGGVNISEWDLGGDRRNVDGSRGFSSSGGQNNCKKYLLPCCRLRVGMATSGRIPGGFRSVAHQIIHFEAAGHHYGAHFQPSHIWTMQGGRRDSWIQKILEVKESRCGKGSRVTWKNFSFKDNCVGAVP